VGRLHYDIVKLLMENGANVNLRHSEVNYSGDPPSSSNSGQKSDEVKQYPSPLEIAISIGDKRMVQVYFKIVFFDCDTSDIKHHHQQEQEHKTT
jgi:ankyrin repeat protein